VVRGRKRGRLLAVALAAVARGLDCRSPELDSFLLDQCTIDRKRGRANVAFDGETENKTLPLNYRIERDALRIVVPPKSAVKEAEAPARASDS
jgi:diacylglycerol kinase family enzyme